MTREEAISDLFDLYGETEGTPYQRALYNQLHTYLRNSIPTPTVEVVEDKRGDLYIKVNGDVAHDGTYGSGLYGRRQREANADCARLRTALGIEAKP